MNIIYPTIPDSKEIDHEYKEEFEYIKKNTNHTALLVDIDMKRAITKNNGEKCIYRGWMLSPEDYSWLRDNYELETTIEEYFMHHYLPNWYYKIEEHTFQSIIYPDVESMMKSTQEIDGYYLLKNYVKSFATNNGPACVNTKEEAASFINSDIFNLHPGVVLREYQELDESSEKRFFVYKNEIAGIDDIPEVVTKVESIIDSDKLYTIDAIKTKTGEWKVIEIGDGQVSSLKEVPKEMFYKLLESK